MNKILAPLLAASVGAAVLCSGLARAGDVEDRFNELMRLRRGGTPRWTREPHEFRKGMTIWRTDLLGERGGLNRVFFSEEKLDDGRVVLETSLGGLRKAMLDDQGAPVFAAKGDCRLDVKDEIVCVSFRPEDGVPDVNDIVSHCEQYRRSYGGRSKNCDVNLTTAVVDGQYGRHLVDELKALRSTMPAYIAPAQPEEESRLEPRSQPSTRVEVRPSTSSTNEGPVFAVQVDVPPGSARGKAYLRIGDARIELDDYAEDCSGCGFIDTGTVSVQRLTHPSASISPLFVDWTTTPGGKGGFVATRFLLLGERATDILGHGEFVSVSGDINPQRPQSRGGLDVEMTANEIVVIVRRWHVNSGRFKKATSPGKEGATVAEGRIRCFYGLDGGLRTGPIEYRVVDAELASAFSFPAHPDWFVRWGFQGACVEGREKTQ